MKRNQITQLKTHILYSFMNKKGIVALLMKNGGDLHAFQS